MSLGFSSIRRQTLFYAIVFFVASLCTSLGISYYYLHRENVTDQYLYQQNVLNFSLQELEDNIFYSKISELSNLSIIRNELYRLYRIVDMSLTAPQDEAAQVTSPYRLNAQALAPSANPNAVTRDVEQVRREENIRQNFNLNQLSSTLTNFTGQDLQWRIATSLKQPISNSLALQNAHDLALDRANSASHGLNQLATRLQQGRTDALNRPSLSSGPGFYSATDIIASANGRYDQMVAHLSALDFTYPPANSSFISSLNHKQDIIPFSNFAPLGLVNPNRLVLYKHLSQLQSLGFIAFSINTKSSAQDLYIHKGYQDLLDNLVNDQRSLRELLYNTPIPANGYFVILESVDGQTSANNPSLSPAARALQERTRSKTAPLSQHSAPASSNPAPSTEPSTESSTESSNESALATAPTTAPNKAPAPGSLTSAASDNPYDAGVLVHATDLDHAIAAAAGNKPIIGPDGKMHRLPEAIEEEEEVPPHLRAVPSAEAALEQGATPEVQQAIARDHAVALAQGAPHNSALASMQQTANLEVGSSEINRGYDAALVNRRLHRDINDIATLTDHGTYLGLISSLSFAKDQVLVIITDITKLQQQDEVLKHLIANSLNQLVLTVAPTTPVSITLLDEHFNPLAGDLSKNEITRLITPAILDETRNHGIFQGYNHRWGHYLTTGYFKPYNWYVLVNIDEVRANSAIWQYLIIIFTVQLVLSIICVFAISEVVDSDVKDLKIINNKVKNMATLIQDADLVERISEGLPRRDDELGTLANYVRLLGKTLYQSIQELSRSGAHSDASIKDSERLLYKNMRKNNINREIFLKEYYKGRFNVHTEFAEDPNGDFYDVIELSPGKIALVVGSLNEHGLQAVNLAMLNIALFRQMIRLTESVKLPLSKAIMELNQNIVDNNSQAVLTTVCIVIIEQQTGRVEYLNAGHTLPMLYHKDAGFEYIDIRTGPVLGAKGSQQYTSITFELQDGDSLLLYSDGLLDCTNHRKEKLGQEGFESLLHDENFDNAVDVVNSLCTKLKRFTKDATLEKDYTIACYHFTKTSVDLIK